jgi:hypothetical protein
MKNIEFRYSDISVGAVVWFTDHKGAERRVKIIESIKNIKGGRDGFVGDWIDGRRDYDGAEVVGYCDQIKKIEE